MDGPRQDALANGMIQEYALRLLAFLAVGATLLAGCQNCLHSAHTDIRRSSGPYECHFPDNLAAAQGNFLAAAWQEDHGREACVDLYYQAAMQAWQHLESLANLSATGFDRGSAWQVYQRSLERLIVTGRRYGRLDPRGSLVVTDARGRRIVPIAFHGFAWKPSEFCQVLPARDFQDSGLARHYRTSGLGVSLVGVRHAGGDEEFFRPRQAFAVTAVLRPVRLASRAMGGGNPSDFRAPDAVLEFRNPCLFDSLPVGPALVGMERDLTAPFAYQLEETPRRFTEGFLDPGDADVKPRLLLMEPYQRGKIPLIFIHGLWSDAATWADAVNTLRAQGDIYRQYQFWFFAYPTGGDLLESVAALRRKLTLARDSFDPAHCDIALDRMVLIGHSMGGLVAKLQVTYAFDILWRQAARQPLEAVRATPAMRERLRRAFFFDPSPSVKRVVFLGTPHRGSTRSRRLLGRAASSLVRYPGPEEAKYEQLMESNRDVFLEYLWDSRPTSIELLDPSNPLLRAMACMPFGRDVRLHSIIGTGGAALGGEVSDGMVPVSSARQSGVCSELFVPVRHEKLHRSDAAVADILRILREHARDSTIAPSRGAECRSGQTPVFQLPGSGEECENRLPDRLPGVIRASLSPKKG